MMKGVTFVTDKSQNRKYVQIELTQLEKHQNDIEDLLDVIISESRKDDEEISWEEVKKKLPK